MRKTELRGKLIFEKRKELKYTQNQLAQKACCSQKTISRYERDEVKRCDYDTLKAIEKALNISLEKEEVKGNGKKTGN